MQVHPTTLDSVLRFLGTEGQRSVEAYEERFQEVLPRASRLRPLEAGTRLLEVGIGTGWFLMLSARRGLECVGLDISPQVIAFVRTRAEQNGVSLDLRLGNIEETVLEREAFDVVMAESVFEPVEDWRRGLANVAGCLRPGGVLILTSTNRFSPRSGEYPLPFYGWLPNRLRYWLRRTLEGPDIMELGIDFHQFTYPGLSDGLKEAGFSRVYDIAHLLDPERLNHPTWWNIALLRARPRAVVVGPPRRASSARGAWRGGRSAPPMPYASGSRSRSSEPPPTPRCCALHSGPWSPPTCWLPRWPISARGRCHGRSRPSPWRSSSAHCR